MAIKSGIDQYLENISRIPLLTQDQEIILSRTVREWKDCPSPSPQLEQKGRRAKQKLMISNLRLVVHMAKKYLNRGLEFDDLIQEGSIGLDRAVEKFAPAKGCRFSTYAYWWIRQNITRAITKKSRLIQMPEHAWEKFRKIQTLRGDFHKQYDRFPTVQEIATGLKLPVDLVEFIIQRFLKTDCISLDQIIGEDEFSRLIDLIPCEQADTFEYAFQSYIKDVIDELLGKLTKEEAIVIKMRFGLPSCKPQTLQTVGDVLGVTKGEVHRIQLRALKKMWRTEVIQELHRVA